MRSSGLLVAIILISQSNINSFIRLILLILILMLQIYILFKDNPGSIVFLRFRYIPKYKKLISQYNAKYPCVMQSVSTTDTSFKNLKGIYNLKSYIFIKDESFVIISTENPDIYIEIPFNSIIYHHTISDRNISITYSYWFEIFFKLDNDIERLWFSTLYYNHKLCKKYPDLLCDDQLYDFVCEHFIDKKEYQCRRDIERHNQFSETSIFHKFTNIDAE